MNRKNIFDIMTDWANRDTKTIINSGNTVSLKCQEKLRFLLKFSADPDSAYFRKGRECYDTYVKTLISLIDAYDRANGLHRTTSIPAWPEKSI